MSKPKLSTMFLAAAFLLLPCIAVAQDFDHAHSAFNKVLSQRVSKAGPTTVVDYVGLKASPQALDAYLGAVQAVSKEQYSAFSEPEQLAFLINAYNAFTLKLIIDHYPVTSIRKIGGLFGSPWKMKFFSFLGEQQHLDGIEHGMIRKQFQEPRIHFAVNCASIGCPNLALEAYTAEKLNSQLARAARDFLADENRNYFKPGRVVLSKIFDWYGDDFRKNGNTLEEFLITYFPDSDQARTTLSGPHKITFSEYDWRLNEKR